MLIYKISTTCLPSLFVYSVLNRTLILRFPAKIIFERAAPRLREPARQLDARFAEAESIRFTGLSIARRRAIPRDARSQEKVSGGKILTRLMPHETSASRRKAQSEIVERSLVG
jgi:hypothetical protein